MLQALEWSVRRALKRGVTFVVGLIFVLIGAGFLTHAAFLVLEEWRGTVFALEVLGGLYVVLGGVLMLASRRPRVPVPPAPVTTAATPGMGSAATVALIEAFMTGISAGRGARTRRREDYD